MTELKLVALDDEDLQIISAHLQDAVLRVGDMTYVPGEKRFAAIANRFDWDGAQKNNADSKGHYERRRTAMRFERVLGAQIKGLDIKASNAVLELLAIQFEQTSEPEGFVHLIFAGGGTIRLHVECIEAEMKDLGAAWQTKSKPTHADAATGEES